MIFNGKYNNEICVKFKFKKLFYFTESKSDQIVKHDHIVKPSGIMTINVMTLGSFLNKFKNNNAELDMFKFEPTGLLNHIGFATKKKHVE